MPRIGTTRFELIGHAQEIGSVRLPACNSIRDQRMSFSRAQPRFGYQGRTGARGRSWCRRARYPGLTGANCGRTSLSGRDDLLIDLVAVAVQQLAAQDLERLQFLSTNTSSPRL